MDKKLTVLVGIWLSGVVAGVLLVARWMRMDQPLAETATSIPDSGPAPMEPSTAEGPHGLHRFTEPIVAGAKSDLVRVRHACTRVSHRVGRRSADHPTELTEEPVTAEIA
jgi:hypothetical protein